MYIVSLHYKCSYVCTLGDIPCQQGENVPRNHGSVINTLSHILAFTCTGSSAGKWPCQKDKKCINRSWLCDGDKDCSDGADEKCKNGHIIVSAATSKYILFI